MKLNYAREFIAREQDNIIDLFLMYQIIEIQLFIKLHVSDIILAENKTVSIDDMNKKMNTRTLGKLITKYKTKYSHDDYNLIDDLEIVRKQRNSFMHSIWIMIALGKNKREASSFGKKLIKNYISRADGLFVKILEMPD